MRNVVMAALTALALIIPAQVYAADAPVPHSARVDKIAVVDVQALLNTSKAGKSIQGQIEKQRDTYKGQLSKLEKDLMEDGKKLQDDIANKDTPEFAAKNKAFETKKANYQKQAGEKSQALEKSANGAVLELRKAIIKVVADIADKEHYTIVVTRDNVVIAEKDMDITENVMTQLDKDLPDVKVKTEGAKDDAPAAAPANAPAKK